MSDDSPDNVVSDTIAAIATPPGVGGIGVLRVSGPDALDISLRIVRRPGRGRPRARHAHLVSVVDPAQDERLVDQALLLYMPAPHSFTGEDVVELQGHGGPLVVRTILDLLLQAGARLAQAGEFSLRAFLNGRLDLAQAEAVADLVAAPTPEALAVAADQLAGRLSGASRDIRRACLDLLAQMEAEIDFVDDDVPPMPPAKVAATLDDLDARLNVILAGADRGILQRHGIRVAIVGSPNVGKSSLLNALLATERAIVTEVPGTTRDVLEESFDFDGVPVVLSDTAGIRQTDDLVERLGVERSAQALTGADIALLVLDASRPLIEADHEALRGVRDAAKPSILTLNKRDLPGALGRADVAGLVPGAITCRTSASESDLTELYAALRETIGGTTPNGDLATVASVRHKQALLHASEELQGSRRAVAEGLPADFVTVGLRGAVLALGEITGESATEDLLDTIFAKFCIGK